MTQSINDLILLDLEKRIVLSDGQAKEYFDAISETQLQIENLNSKISELQFWLLEENKHNFNLRSKYNTLQKQFSQE